MSEAEPAATVSSPHRAVLVVQEEPGLLRLISRALGFAGFEVMIASSPGAVEETIASTQPQVAVLDLGLPEGSGFDLAHSLRARQPAIGILFLAARSSQEDCLTAFTLGADDYIPLPFNIAELVARVRALHRRVTTDAPSFSSTCTNAHLTRNDPVPARPDTIVFGELSLDQARYTLTRAGRNIELSPTEFKLLQYLLDNVDVVVSKHQIIRQVWDYEEVTHGSMVEKFISQLRRKLGGPPDAYIRTVRGFGYTLRSPSNF